MIESGVTTNVYVDGFNLYNGCVKDKPDCKWLDLRGFAANLLGKSHTVGAVYWFTAPVWIFGGNTDQRERQNNYGRALRAHSGVVVQEGRFQQNEKTVWIVATGQREKASVLEEKGSDVNLAVRLVWDSFSDHDMTGALVVSNDSDLQEAINMAQKLKKMVVTCNPHHAEGQANHLDGDERRVIDVRHLRRNQLPNPVKDAKGRQIWRPTSWS